MFDPERLLGQMIGGALGGAFGGRRGRHSVFGTGDLATKASVGVGLLGIAMAAYEHYSAQRAPGAAPGATAMPPPPPPAPTGSVATMPPPPPPPIATDASTLAAEPRRADLTLVVQAMVAAAAADGRIDDGERSAILARAHGAGLDADTLAFLDHELATPRTLEAIVSMTRRELAADVYAASLMAISLDTAAERDYLDRLASGLGLDAAQRATIHQQLGVT
jgi:uncharacterized membrane protein YebE (DUF533 family)